uniref:Uncharacterized protein n=1 Tax=Anguilla anguilla TaxID=7936 RepID=A0A0E9PP01_ANGAN
MTRCFNKQHHIYSKKHVKHVQNSAPAHPNGFHTFINNKVKVLCVRSKKYMRK